MSSLHKVFKRSRFVTIAPDGKGVAVEANMWQNLEELDPFTINIRGYGSTINSASDNVLLKMQQLGIE